MHLAKALLFAGLLLATLNLSRADARDDEIAKRLDDAARRVREKRWPDGMIEFLRECRETNHMALCTMMGDLVVKGDEAKQRKEGLPRTALPWEFWDEYAICQYYIGRKEQSFDAIEVALGDPNIPEAKRFRLHDNRHYPMVHIKERFAKYNDTAIKALTEQLKSVDADSQVDVCVTMTTSKRLELFKKTMDSFINACSDINEIQRWVVVDDNSSEDDRLFMKENYPFITLHSKGENEKGHARSMNILRDQYWSKCKYAIHIEDDYVFFARKPYVRLMKRILEAEPKVGQVLVNRNYAEVHSQWHTRGGLYRQIPDADTREGAAKITYYIHQFFPEGSPEYTQYLEQINNEPNFAYWPHFSFRPCMIRTSIFNDLPRFEEDIGALIERQKIPSQQLIRGFTGFEPLFAFQYTEKGYKTAFLDGVNAVTTGKTVYDESTRDSKNAYELNSLDQFFKVPDDKIASGSSSQTTKHDDEL